MNIQITALLIAWIYSLLFNNYNHGISDVLIAVPVMVAK